MTNIMIDSSRQIKIVDFGYSEKVNSKQDKIENFSGTPAYIAPEIIKKIPYNGKIYKDLNQIFGLLEFYFIKC